MTIKRVLIIFVLLFASPVLSFQKALNNTDIQKYVKQIEQFFNNISSFQSDFVEINSRGWQSLGFFRLKRRPAMLKMDYTDPPTKTITVKNNKVIYYDKELKEKSVTSVYSSPLAFFLDPKINIRDNLEIISCLKTNNALMVAFRKKNDKDEENGVVVLAFSLNPFLLTGWEIYRRSDQMDIEIPIRIYLKNQRINQNISDSEFEG